jgi:hypothetical protein
MQSQPTRPEEPCPVCGAEPAYRVWSEMTGYGFVSIVSEKHALSGSQARPLVCIVCGYVQLFVDPEDFHSQPHVSLKAQ